MTEVWEDVAKSAHDRELERRAQEREIIAAGWLPSTSPPGLWWHPDRRGEAFTLADALYLVREELYGDF